MNMEFLSTYLALTFFNQNFVVFQLSHVCYWSYETVAETWKIWVFLNILCMHSRYTTNIYHSLDTVKCMMAGKRPRVYHLWTREPDLTVFHTQIKKINVDSNTTHVPNSYSILLFQKFRTSHCSLIHLDLCLFSYTRPSLVLKKLICLTRLKTFNSA